MILPNPEAEILWGALEEFPLEGELGELFLSLPQFQRCPECFSPPANSLSSLGSLWDLNTLLERGSILPSYPYPRGDPSSLFQTLKGVKPSLKNFHLLFSLALLITPSDQPVLLSLMEVEPDIHPLYPLFFQALCRVPGTFPGVTSFGEGLTLLYGASPLILTNDPPRFGGGFEVESSLFFRRAIDHQPESADHFALLIRLRTRQCRSYLISLLKTPGAPLVPESLSGLAADQDALQLVFNHFITLKTAHPNEVWAPLYLVAIRTPGEWSMKWGEILKAHFQETGFPLPIPTGGSGKLGQDSVLASKLPLQWKFILPLSSVLFLIVAWIFQSLTLARVPESFLEMVQNRELVKKYGEDQDRLRLGLKTIDNQKTLEEWEKTLGNSPPSQKKKFLEILPIPEDFLLLEWGIYKLIEFDALDRAKSWCRKWQILFPQSPAPLALLGYLLWREKKFDLAYDLTQKGRKLDPFFPGIHELLGDIAFHQGEKEKGKEFYRKESTLYPWNGSALRKWLSLREGEKSNPGSPQTKE